jgi:thiol-disulfide isomerase/thioredoxin
VAAPDGDQQAQPATPEAVAPRRRPLGFRRQARNFVLLVLLAVVVSVVSIAIASRIRPPASLLTVGSRAPAIQPASSGGPAPPEQVALHAGHPLVVEFFETTCPVCQAAAPRLCDLLQGHPAASLVAVDAAGEDGSALAGFRSDHYAGCSAASRIALIADPCPQQPASSSGLVCDNVTSRWKVSVVPTVYVVDAQGFIVAASSGSGAVDDAGAALDRLPAVPPGP